MRALVTGGTGFVGSAVVRALLDEGYQVTCLVRAQSDLRNLQRAALARGPDASFGESSRRPLDVTLAEGDLADKISLADALRGCQEVYHVAALYSTRAEDAQRLFDVNVGGTRNLLQVAADQSLQHLVHTSTIGTIGPAPTGRLPTEQDVLTDWSMASPYARSKLLAEQVALDMAQQGLPLVVVNPCAPVGARDIKPSSTGARIIAYLSGRIPSFLPGGINFVAVDDVARGHLLAARHGRPGQRYILGNAQGNLLLADFCRLMQRVSGVRPPRPTVRARIATWKTHVGQILGGTAPPSAIADHRPIALTADPSRAIHDLGLPQTELDVAFRQAIVWFRANHYV